MNKQTLESINYLIEVRENCNYALNRLGAMLESQDEMAVSNTTAPTLTKLRAPITVDVINHHNIPIQLKECHLGSSVTESIIGLVTDQIDIIDARLVELGFDVSSFED